MIRNSTWDGPFIRLPTSLCEDLLQHRLSGVEWAILIWLVRSTIGWHRVSRRTTWSGIARSLRVHRSTVLRASVKLQKAGIVLFENGQLRFNPQFFDAQTFLPPVALEQQPRRIRATVFRAAKDTGKEKHQFHPAGAAQPKPGKYA
jgi:phage replication O-like protein O